MVCLAQYMHKGSATWPDPGRQISRRSPTVLAGSRRFTITAVKY